LRIVYFGTGEFAIPPLEAIAEHTVLVVTQPDRPSGRGMSLKPSPVKRAALELGLPVETPEKSRAPEFVELIRALEADAMVVASYGQILSQALLEATQRGGINLHGSILPKYRGAAPIQRAILEGETETGVTLMQMDKGMDTGDVIDIVRTPIGPDETYGELQNRLASLAADQIREWLPRIVAGDYPRQPQDHESATIAPKVDRAESELRFDNEAAREYNRFRAFTPNPGTFLRIEGIGTVKLHQVGPSEGSAAPGTVLSVQPFPRIAFENGSLELIEVQPEGKKRMSGRDWINGLRLRPGENLRNG